MSGEQRVTTLSKPSGITEAHLHEWEFYRKPDATDVLMLIAAHRETEANLKTVLDREAVTIKRYEDKLDEAEAKLEAAEKSADWWRTRVARLASMEAFGLSRMIDQKADAELLLRIKYAECALTEGLTLTTKETTDETAVRA